MTVRICPKCQRPTEYCNNETGICLACDVPESQRPQLEGDEYGDLHAASKDPLTVATKDASSGLCISITAVLIGSDSEDSPEKFAYTVKAWYEAEFHSKLLVFKAEAVHYHYGVLKLCEYLGEEGCSALQRSGLLEWFWTQQHAEAEEGWKWACAGEWESQPNWRFLIFEPYRWVAMGQASQMNKAHCFGYNGKRIVAHYLILKPDTSRLFYFNSGGQRLGSLGAIAGYLANRVNAMVPEEDRVAPELVRQRMLEALVIDLGLSAESSLDAEAKFNALLLKTAAPCSICQGTKTVNVSLPGAFPTSLNYPCPDCTMRDRGQTIALPQEAPFVIHMTGLEWSYLTAALSVFSHVQPDLCQVGTKDALASLMRKLRHAGLTGRLITEWLQAEAEALRAKGAEAGLKGLAGADSGGLPSLQGERPEEGC